MVGICWVTMMAKMVMMMMMIMVRHMTAVVNRDLAPNALTWNQAKLGKEGFCKRSFFSLVYPPQNHGRSSQVYGRSGKLPMSDKWKDNKGLKHRFTAAGMTWALRESEGYFKDSATHCTVLLIEAITANSMLPFTLVSLILKKL